MLKKVLTLACAGVLAISAAYAVPASNKPIVVTQPDGSELTLIKLGDEFFHCLMTEDGYLVKKAEDGGYNYVDNSGKIMSLRASNSNTRSEAVKATLQTLNPETTFYALKSESLQRSKMWNSNQMMRKAIQRANGDEYDNNDGHDLRVFPTEGEQNVLVICVNFVDKGFSFDPNPHEAMNDMMNKVGYDGYGASGSSYDFYYTSSAGQFLPKFDVYGPINLPQTYAYYGANDMYGSDRNAGEMIKDALDILDDQIDYSNYDRNDDGYVDNVYVFYAGFGEADTMMENTIWPHSWQLQYALGYTPEYDGVKVDKYATSNELSGDSSFDGIGTFCHEFAHVLGLPDLYETTYSTGAFTPGEYSAMDSGPYNGNGYVPPTFSSYERYALEWLNPVLLDHAVTINVAPLTRGNVAYKIPANKDNAKEYFLFENRQQESWDEYIPGHGMIIWHIDYDEQKWYYNQVNNTPDHQHVDIIEADNTPTAGTRGGDTFPGTNNVYEFTESSRPAFKNWSNEGIDYPITEISESLDGVITFKVNGGGDSTSPYFVSTPECKVSESNANSITLTWNEVEEADGYRLTFYPYDESDGTELYAVVGDYITKDLGNVTSITIDELEAETNYVARLYAYNRYNMSAVSQVYASTYGETIEDTTPILTAGNIGETTVDLAWVPVPNADNYQLTVATRTTGESTSSEVATFNNKKFPSNQWFSYGSWETRDAYCGEAPPSLKLQNTGDLLETPMYDKEIGSISFWTRLSHENTSVRVEIYGKDGYSVYPITTITEFSATEEGETIEINDIPYGTRQISLYLYFAATDIKLYIDDVRINFQGEITDTPVAGFDKLQVSGTEQHVTGLTAETEYVAYVKAIGAEGESKESRAIRFTTGKTGAVDKITSDNTLRLALVDGRIIATEEAIFDIYSIDGRVIALSVGNGYQLPAKGLYIVRSGAKAAKINW